MEDQKGPKELILVTVIDRDGDLVDKCGGTVSLVMLPKAAFPRFEALCKDADLLITEASRILGAEEISASTITLQAVVMDLGGYLLACIPLVSAAHDGDLEEFVSVEIGYHGG